MRIFTIITVAAAALAIAVGVAGPAAAVPGDGPCSGGLNPLCLLVPTLPNLDHDVDLTEDPHGLDGAYGQPAPAPQPAN